MLGTFPHLLTSASPTHTQLVDLNNLNGPPFGPSADHPLGRDYFGRDLLARTLYATWPTLLPVILITAFSVGIGLFGATVCAVTSYRGIGRGVSWLAETMASLPVLPLVFMALYDRNYQASGTLQTVQFVGWLTLFSAGRSVVAFRSAIDGWFLFGFIEGVESVGKGRTATLVTHLRSWLSQYTVEYAFSEFARVTSLVTVLAAMHIYVVERWGYLPFIVPSHGLREWPSQLDGDDRRRHNEHGLRHVSISALRPACRTLARHDGSKLHCKGSAHEAGWALVVAGASNVLSPEGDARTEVVAVNERDRQEKLRREMTDTEEAYHQAYPDSRAPITAAVVGGVFSRYGRYMIVGGVVGALVAIAFWVILWRVHV